MAEQEAPFEKDYSEDGFWAKAKGVAKSAGLEVLERGLQCYYVLQEPSVPAWARTTVMGALGYFISPLDAIPDMTPVVGYADDLGVLTLALSAVALHITSDVKQKAKAKLNDLFGA